VDSTQPLSPPQRFVTETTDTAATSSATPPKKSTFSFTKIVVYTAAATTTFYVGGLSWRSTTIPTILSSNKTIPFAPSVLQYGEDHGWDSLTITDVIVNTYDGVSGTYSYVRKQLGVFCRGAAFQGSPEAKIRQRIPLRADRTKPRLGSRRLWMHSKQM
jgi:hypothetical protein